MGAKCFSLFFFPFNIFRPGGTKYVLSTSLMHVMQVHFTWKTDTSYVPARFFSFADNPRPVVGELIPAHSDLYMVALAVGGPGGHLDGAQSRIALYPAVGVSLGQASKQLYHTAYNDT